MPVTAPTNQLRNAARCGWSIQTLCKLSEIAECIRVVVRAMRSHNYLDRDQHAVRIALDESLTNAIRHGTREHSDKLVFLRYLVLTDHVWIEVEDEGDGFDPNDVPEPRRPYNLVRHSGRGLYLMRTFMNLVEHSNGGRIVLMSKRRGGTLGAFRGKPSAKASWSALSFRTLR